MFSIGFRGVRPLLGFRGAVAPAVRHEIPDLSGYGTRGTVETVGNDREPFFRPDTPTDFFSILEAQSEIGIHEL